MAKHTFVQAGEQYALVSIIGEKWNKKLLERIYPSYILSSCVKPQFFVRWGLFLEQALAGGFHGGFDAVVDMEFIQDV